jgi:hypothetical protein
VSVTVEKSPATLGAGRSPTAAVDVSVVVVVDERPEQLADLYIEYSPALRASGRSFEFVFITGSAYRHLLDSLDGLVRNGAPVRILEAQTVGEAALLKAAAGYCRGAIILTLPSYRRVEPPALVDLIVRIEKGADLAVAHRWPRRDSWINRVQNRAIHSLVRASVGGNLHDLGCGVRAIRTEVLASLPLYGDFYRFLPIIALREGYTVEEVPAAQHLADVKARVYAPGIYLRRLIDIVGLFFLIRFREKPLRFFGLFGVSFSLIGVAVLSVLSVQRMAGRPMADRPLLLLGLMLVVLGIQIFSLGLIGEIIVHFQMRDRSVYRIREARRSTPPATPTRS